MRARLAVLALYGCGRVHFDALPDAPLGAFSAPSAITELNTPGGETNPAVTGDLLELYFDSDRNGTTDIFVTTRASVDAPWDPPNPVVELDTASFDGAPGITPDGLIMFFTSNRPGGAGNFDIWTTTRPTRTSPWAAPVFVPELSTSDDDSNPQPTPGALAVWLGSKRNGATARQLYRATRASLIDPFSTPVMGELDVDPAIATSDPWVSNDGLEIFFSSDRPGGAGANDLWHATRATVDDPFGDPSPLVELNTSSGEVDPDLSLDRRVIFFTSHRGGDDNLYYATR